MEVGMDKLEAWLREKGELYQRIGQQDYRDRMIEAADEITRLNAEVERARADALEEAAELADATAADVSTTLKNKLRDPAGLFICLANDIRALILRTPNRSPEHG
jgi:hypothetical protein